MAAAAKDLLKQADAIAASGDVDPESELGSLLATYAREKTHGTERAQVAHARVIVRRAAQQGIETKPARSRGARTGGSSAKG